MEARTLLIMVGGEAAVLEEYRPVLEAMGDKIFHLGPSGSETRMKLVVNLVAAAKLAALAESLALGGTYALTLGREVQTPLPVTGLVSRIYTAGLREHGEKD